MKLHFGHGVFAIAAAFVIFIFFLVFNMLGQKVDLVEQNYYQKGLDYQQEIEKQSREKERFSLKQEGSVLVLSGQKPEGDMLLQFYRPSDSQLDTSFILTTDAGQKLENPGLQSGFWKVKLNWKEGDQAYYQQAEMMWK